MKREIITQSDPKSPISEVFRSLRTNIQFKNMGGALKTLLVTSTLQSEGKSTVTANLAVTFAQAGRKTLIIDSDMRKARQHEIFNLKPVPGLSNYLSGIDETGYDASDNVLDYVQKTTVENLYVMPAGNVPPNPSELLISDAMGTMMEKLRKTFDFVIFDGTPSLLVTDAVILSRIADSCIIVVSHKETKMDNLAKVKKDIENVGGKIAGVVLNKVPISKNKYKEKYYYGEIEADVEEIPTVKKGKRLVVKEDKKKEPTIDGQQVINEGMKEVADYENIADYKEMHFQESKNLATESKALAVIKIKDNNKKGIIVQFLNFFKIKKRETKSARKRLVDKREIRREIEVPLSEESEAIGYIDVSMHRGSSKLESSMDKRKRQKSRQAERIGTKRKIKLNASKGA